MERDTRGDYKKNRDAAKRNNLKEIKERQYKKDQRFAQSQGGQDDSFEEDDSHKFLRKQKEKEAKQQLGSQKAQIYEEEMAKCQPKPKGRA